MPEYYLLDPTGNITILADMPDNPEDRLRLPDIARGLMELEPDAEQTGFIGGGDDLCEISLSMAGGEFCGNATMSAAAVYCMDMPEGEERTLSVRVSGSKRPVGVKIKKKDASSFEGTVRMPDAVSVTEERLEYEDRIYSYPVVGFEGISHIICTEPVEREFAEKAIRKWCSDLGADALGIMQIDESAGSLLPLVFVRAADTLFWESSCASGTTAAGVFFARKYGRTVDMSFAEPAGNLAVRADTDGSAFLTGSVRIIKKPASV